VLLNYFLGSLKLVLLSVPPSVLIGTILGFFAAHGRWRFQKVQFLFLMLCLSTPAYLLGYVYINALQDWFPFVRNIWMCSVILILNTIPYSFLISRSAFSQIPKNMSEASRGLGFTKPQVFWRVLLPCVKKSIVLSALITTMDVLSDFGTVEYFALDTLATGVYRTWFAHGNPAAAVLLSLPLSCFTLFFVIANAKVKGQVSSESSENVESKNSIFNFQKQSSLFRIVLNFCFFVPGFLGFVFPALYLFWNLSLLTHFPLSEFWNATVGTVGVGLGAATMVLFTSLLFCQFLKVSTNYKAKRTLETLVAFCYALPGTVAALAFFPINSTLLGAAFAKVQDIGNVWYFGVSLFLLSFFMFVKYSFPANNSLAKAFQLISPSYFSQASVLGAGFWKRNYHGTYRALIPTLLGGAIMCILEVFKELPISVALRPFGLETLAIRAYLYASDELLANASPYLLFIMLVGSMPVIFSNFILRERRK
jgi:iron(III) transport system permease protein